jgi:hypothetical protein
MNCETTDLRLTPPYFENSTGRARFAVASGVASRTNYRKKARKSLDIGELHELVEVPSKGQLSERLQLEFEVG